MIVFCPFVIICVSFCLFFDSLSLLCPASQFFCVPLFLFCVLVVVPFNFLRHVAVD